jgi:16S rRNA (guanine966-N2)-methyltransferase
LRLDVPKKHELRPTQDRIKQVIFSSLGERVIGARVLDLYAGTGGLGIEALSRGAASAVFVEENAEAAQCIQSNLARCRLEGGTVVRQEAARFLAAQNADKYDLIFADPPYDKTRNGGEIPSFLGMLPDHLAENGLVVWEHFARKNIVEVAGYKIIRNKNYGETGLTFLQLIK